MMIKLMAVPRAAAAAVRIATSSENAPSSVRIEEVRAVVVDSNFEFNVQPSTCGWVCTMRWFDSVRNLIVIHHVYEFIHHYHRAKRFLRICAYWDGWRNVTVEFFVRSSHGERFD